MATEKTNPKAPPEEATAYPEASSLTIAQRICRVIIDADRVVKRGQTKFGEQYSYARIDDVMAALREPMARHGLVLHWSMAHREVSEYGPTKNGVMQWRHTVLVDFALKNADLGDEEPWKTTLEGDAIDTGDKGMGKALSYAFKNYLLKTFLLPSGDEADNEAHEVTPQAAPAQQQRSPEEEAHRKAQSAFFAALGDLGMDKDAAKALALEWLKRNYKLESTKVATVDQLKGARAWALGYKEAMQKVQTATSQGGVDLMAVAKHISETYGVDNPGTLNLAEWAELAAWVAKAPAESPEDAEDMAALDSFTKAAGEKLDATPEEES